MASTLLMSQVARWAGDSTPLALLLAGMSSFAVGLVTAGFARRFPGAGAFYDYVGAGLGKVGSFLAGWSYTFALFILACGGTCFLASFTSDFLAQELDLHLPWQLLLVVLNLILCVVTVVDVRYSTRAQLAITMVSAVGLLACAAVTVFSAGSRKLGLVAFSPAHINTGDGFGIGLTFALTMFAGFESAAVLGEETKNPERTIPRAIMLTVVLSAVYYVTLGYAFIVGFPSSKALAADEAALLTLVGTHVGKWAVPVAFLAAMIDGFAGSIAAVNGMSRVAMVMAREGTLPHMFAVIHPKYGTPWISCVAVTVLSTTVAFVFAAASSVQVEFIVFLGVGASLIQLVYVLLGISALALAPRSLERLSTTGKQGARRDTEKGVGRNWLHEPLNDQSLLALIGAWAARVALPVVAVICPLAALHATLRPVLHGQWPDVLVLPTVVVWLFIGCVVIFVLRSRYSAGGNGGSGKGLSVQGGTSQPPYVSAADVYGDGEVGIDDIERLLGGHSSEEEG